MRNIAGLFQSTKDYHCSTPKLKISGTVGWRNCFVETAELNTSYFGMLL